MLVFKHDNRAPQFADKSIDNRDSPMQNRHERQITPNPFSKAPLEALSYAIDL